MTDRRALAVNCILDYGWHCLCPRGLCFHSLDRCGGFKISPLFRAQFLPITGRFNYMMAESIPSKVHIISNTLLSLLRVLSAVSQRSSRRILFLLSTFTSVSQHIYVCIGSQHMYRLLSAYCSVRCSVCAILSVVLVCVQVHTRYSIWNPVHTRWCCIIFGSHLSTY